MLKLSSGGEVVFKWLNGYQMVKRSSGDKMVIRW